MNGPRCSFFVFRTPLLPFDEYIRWGDGLRAPSAADGEPTDLEEALASDRALLRRRLREAIANPVFYEALFTASPDLVDSLGVWQRDPESARGQRVERALVRYFSRATYRATPFGLFAGWSIGLTGPGTDLRLGPAACYRRRTKLDMGYLASLVDQTVANPEVRRYLQVRPNSSLYAAAGRLHYVTTHMESGIRAYRLTAADGTPYLEATIARARCGASVGDLAAALVDEEVDADDAAMYVNELVDHQILVPELAVPVTGEDPVAAIIDNLRGIPPAESTARYLGDAQRALAALDERGLGVPCTAYELSLQELPPLDAPPKAARRFQVDLMKPTSGASLGAEPLQDLIRGAQVLRRITPDRDALRPFIDAFHERYEQREVPLAEALDEEVGIGLPKSESAAQERESSLAAQRRQVVLTECILRGQALGQDELALSETDLERLSPPDPPPLPDSFSIGATLAARSLEAVAHGDYRVIMHGVMGPSGAAPLGRFCYMDATLAAHVERHLRAEEALRPDAVFCEVAHLPQGRIGNILFRPVLRDYEIPYLGRSGTRPERQLPLNDLTVSVAGSSIVLRSQSLGREVVPRLTSAHNYLQEGQLSLYRFLGLLQTHRVASRLAWEWGPLTRLPFLPRVTLDRLVLSRAAWGIPTAESRELAKLSGAARYRAARAWRLRRRLPRFVVFADGDHQLPIDLDSTTSLDVLVELMGGHQPVTLVEMYPTPDELCCESPEGRFTHELVVPVVNSQPVPPRAGPPRAVAMPPKKRSYPPGSEWLYLKLYTGPALADRILRDALGHLLRRATSLGVIEGWFFLRYTDPHYHLRLRFRGAPSRLREELLPTLESELGDLVSRGLVWRVQYDTYEREIERYGGPESIGLAEQVFHADSEAVLRLMDVAGWADETLRDVLALRSLDALLADFGLGYEGKLALLRHASGPPSPATRREWSTRYRRQRAHIETALGSSDSERSLPPDAVRILKERSEQLRPVAAALKEAEQSSRMARPLNDVLLSFTHMSANRMSRSLNNTAWETMLYDFLCRYYESILARQRTVNHSRGAGHQ